MTDQEIIDALRSDSKKKKQKAETFLATPRASFAHPTSGNNNHFTLFPNPTNGNLTVKHSDTEGVIQHIKIKDLTGKQFLNKVLNDRQAPLDVTHLPSGLYFLTIKMLNGQQNVRKFMKN